MKTTRFLFNRLRISVTLEELMKAADIEDIESGMGYTLNKSIRKTNDKYEWLEIIDFCLTRGGKTTGEMVIGIKDGDKIIEEYADWCISSDSEINATIL